MISDYENNRSNMSINKLIKIADHFNVSIDYLIGRQKENKTNLKQVLEFKVLIEMLRELDTEKNDKETVKEVLQYIANDLEKFIDYIK